MGMDGYQTYRGEHFTTYTNIKSRSSAPDINIISYTNGGTSGKESPASAGDAGDMGSIPGSGRSPGRGNDIPLQYSCLENPIDRGV